MLHVKTCVVLWFLCICMVLMKGLMDGKGGGFWVRRGLEGLSPLPTASYAIGLSRMDRLNQMEAKLGEYMCCVFWVERGLDGLSLVPSASIAIGLTLTESLHFIRSLLIKHVSLWRYCFFCKTKWIAKNNHQPKLHKFFIKGCFLASQKYVNSKVW